MKNLITNGVAIGCMITILSACTGNKEEPATPSIDKEAIKKEIQAKENEFADLYNKGEMRNIGYYADDAITYYQNRPPLVGKEEILKFLKDDIISNTDKISFVTTEVFVSSDGNQVVEIGAFKVVDSLGNPFNTGNYMCLFEKRNGKYVALRDMSASDIPFE